MNNEKTGNHRGSSPNVNVMGVTQIPEIHRGDRIGEIILTAIATQGLSIQKGDIVIVTQKIVSKSEGRLVHLDTIKPSTDAFQLAAQSGKDPRLVELVIQESKSIVRTDSKRGIIISETRHGFVCANAGIDTSNIEGDDTVALLPEDPDYSAELIYNQMKKAGLRFRVPVIISDTFGRPWREGQTNVAIGISGIAPLKDYRGDKDMFGNVLSVTNIAIVDELASAAELVMGKTDRIPVAIVRGYFHISRESTSNELIRDCDMDLFR